jgi:hypothetical protein
VRVQAHPKYQPSRRRPPKPAPQQPPEDGGNNKLQLGADLAHLATAKLSSAVQHSAPHLETAVALLGQQGETLVGNSLFRGGAAALNVGVAAAASWRGIQGLRSHSKLEKLEGANNLLLGTGSGLIASNLISGSAEISHWGGKFMLAHGVGDIGLGGYRAVRGHGAERLSGVLQAAHGSCLVAAELFHAAAVPLCVAMLGLSAAQLFVAGVDPNRAP